MKYIPRAIEPTILKFSQTFPVLCLTGARQVGKTTVLQHVAEEQGNSRRVISLDNLEARKLAQNDPNLFLQRYRPPILIDEVQYAPQLFDAIKLDVDTHPNEKGRYWLTGSQPFHLMKGISQSLAGRIVLLELSPLSEAEKSSRETQPFLPSQAFFERGAETAKTKSEIALFESMLKGGYPAMFDLESTLREAAFESYISTYLLRDIRELTQVNDELAFRTFLQACAALTARPVNYAELARLAEVTIPTAKSWLSLLVSTYIIKLVQPYYTNQLKRLRKSPVLHFCDSGLASYLSGWTEASALAKSAVGGFYLESFCYAQIERSYTNEGKTARLHTLRANDKQEIDLVLEDNNMLYPIEIKQAGRAQVSDCKHFSLLQKTQSKVGIGTVLCLCKDTLPITREAWQYPIWAL